MHIQLVLAIATGVIGLIVLIAGLATIKSNKGVGIALLSSSIIVLATALTLAVTSKQNKKGNAQASALREAIASPAGELSEEAYKDRHATRCAVASGTVAVAAASPNTGTGARSNATQVVPLAKKKSRCRIKFTETSDEIEFFRDDPPTMMSPSYVVGTADASAAAGLKWSPSQPSDDGGGSNMDVRVDITNLANRPEFAAANMPPTSVHDVVAGEGMIEENTQPAPNSMNANNDAEQPVFASAQTQPLITMAHENTPYNVDELVRSVVPTNPASVAAAREKQTQMLFTADRLHRALAGDRMLNKITTPATSTIPFKGSAYEVRRITSQEYNAFNKQQHD